MAVSVVGVGDNKRDVYGATEIGVFDMTLDNSYPAGGYVLTSQTFGVSRPLLAVEPMGGNTASVVWNYFWNTQTSKFQVLGASGGAAGTAANADATAATDLHLITVRVMVTTQR